MDDQEIISNIYLYQAFNDEAAPKIFEDVKQLPIIEDDFDPFQNLSQDENQGNPIFNIPDEERKDFYQTDESKGPLYFYLNQIPQVSPSHLDCNLTPVSQECLLLQDRYPVLQDMCHLLQDRSPVLQDKCYEFQDRSPAKSQITKKIHKVEDCAKKSEKKKKANEEKNIHRYMVRQIIHSLALPEFKEIVDQLCKENEISYEDCTKYFLEEIESFTNLTILRNHWMITSEDTLQNRRNKVFKEFSKWFLKERAIRYILNGKMQNKKAYIRYKNKVMLYFIDNPNSYCSNRLSQCDDSDE